MKIIYKEMPSNMHHSLCSELTYTCVRRSSPGVVGVRRVKLGAGFQARGGHGIWAGHRYFAGMKTRLKEKREQKVKRVLLIIPKGA